MWYSAPCHHVVVIITVNVWVTLVLLGVKTLLGSSALGITVPHVWQDCQWNLQRKHRKVRCYFSAIVCLIAWSCQVRGFQSWTSTASTTAATISTFTSTTAIVVAADSAVTVTIFDFCFNVQFDIRPGPLQCSVLLGTICLFSIKLSVKYSLKWIKIKQIKAK